MKLTLGMLKAFMISRIRDKSALFWTLAFPIMFLIIFGLAFGGTSTTSVSTGTEEIRYAILIDEDIDASVEKEILDASDKLNLKPLSVDSELNLKQSVEYSLDNVDFGIRLFKVDGKWRVKGYYNADDVTRLQMYEALVQNLVTELRKELAGFENILNVKTVNKEFSDEPITSTGYIMSGVIAVSITLSGITALIVSFGYYRKQNIIKRLLSTPLKGSQFLAADIINNLIISLATIIIILIFAKLIFSVSFHINLLYLSVTYFTSMFLMMGLGGLFLLIFREPNAAMNIANVFSTIMMFFAGVYFPLELLPKWLQGVGAALPMTYIAQNIRFALGQDYMSLSRFWVVNGVFALIALIIIPVVGRSIFNLEKN
ncbi:MAG TPA: ABC transporter permease [Thermotogota bacterium]|nr:ABC transporter permease [Thermotogota bacterium]HPJ89614.1 ABC transporter permease [Thermotogota bacterium]HPR96797.1 ABC transporter permease [Thermotogota bacterium]